MHGREKIDIQSKGDNLSASFNALDIKRVLQNLVINAGYVTEDDGTIVISAEPVNGNMQVRVTDTGCGIPEEIQPYLFKEVMTTKKDGSGLELLPCKNIIEDNHQGKFWFESKTGEGTSFFFSFPI
ncbi:MAG TPA: hypothetical protein DCX78_08175 [Nitrospina sp.]|nr:hypothetical protein [Nitrospinota bacterium]HAX46783.1 hypothetical protein [Nitrospina sp.]